MKRILIFFIFILLSVSVFAQVDMKDYPYFFEENNEFQTTIVVGNQAPSSDVLAATDVVGYLVFETKSDNVATILSSEVPDNNMNMVVIGNPCTNPLSAELLGTSECEVTDKGDALIKVIEHNQYVHVVVAGNTEQATRVAAKVLQEPDRFILRGTEICVYGSMTLPQADECVYSRYEAPVEQVQEEDEPEEEVIPFDKKYEKPRGNLDLNIECPGCKDKDGLCYSVDETISINGKTAYCKEDQQWYEAKPLTDRCNEDVQCTSGHCIEGVCSARVDKDESFLTKFFKWVFGVFFE